MTTAESLFSEAKSRHAASGGATRSYKHGQFTPTALHARATVALSAEFAPYRSFAA